MSHEQHPDDALTRALRAMAQDDESLGASPGVEARLLAEAHIIARADRRRTYGAAAMLAAGLVVAIALFGGRIGPRTPAVEDAATSSLVVPASDELVTDFYPLRYFNVPVTGGHTVRIELPQASLTAFGLEPDAVSATVVADVLVGHDGLARAVRFLRPAAVVSEESRRR